MTKTKLLGGIVALVIGFSTPAYASTPEQVYAKSAPIATVASQLVEAKKKTTPANNVCNHFLVRELEQAGFKGRSLRIAWAIAMRESGGRADAISSTGDYGVFQFNKAAHSDQPWWNTAKLLTRDYNIMIAYDMSQGGKTFYPWDIDGKGNWKANYTSRSSYQAYQKWFYKYPC